MKNILEIGTKIILVSFLISILFCTFCSDYAYAEEMNLKEEFDTSEWNPTSSTFNEKRKLTEIGNRIIGTIQVIGSFASVIALIIIGIRYMVGSVEEKAQYKETMVPYIIGAVLVFGITTTLRIVYDIAQSIN